jgi:ubiquinone/menaquinone biosynthesis C-methylase UbiE
MQTEKLLDSYRHIVTMAFWRAVELAAVAKYIHYLKGEIIDIGCGDGSIASLVFGGDPVSVGYDVEKQSVEMAKLRYRTVLVADARYHPFRDARFDGLFSNSSIEHFFEVGKCFDEFRRIAKKGSFFLFTVVSGSFYDSFWCSRLGTRSFGKGWIERHRRLRQHLNIWDVDVWKDFLEKHGFELVEHQHYFNPRSTFWWSLMEDALTWPLHMGLLVTTATRLIPERILRKMITRLIEKDEDLCTRSGKGSGLLLVARKRD